MAKLTESAIEEFAIKLFQGLGYSYVYGPDIAPGAELAEREKYSDVVLQDRLLAAVKRINPRMPDDVLKGAVK